jgi:acyl transferase domain-containing protein
MRKSLTQFFLVPMEKAKLRVPLEPTAWPEDRHERASVNSFGIGGANAHVILDSAASFLPDFHSSRNSTVESSSSHNLLVFSANSPDSLRRNASTIQQYINSYPDTVSDVSYNLSVRRDHLPHRAFSVIKESGQELHISNFVKARRTAPSVHYVFTGQGAQWAGMGYDLMSAFPEFKKDILEMDKTLQALPDGPAWTIHGT